MALVHETLYRSENFARIEPGGYIESICAHLFRACGVGESRVQLQIQSNVRELDPERAIPLGLIINELVSNALKYAFVGNRLGHLFVGLQSGPALDNSTEISEYTLLVQDDGVGFPPNLDISRQGSLGLHLVNLLTRQLRGRVTVATGAATQAACGTTFTIVFPARPR
jgi:two-component sensor histidine kinase